MAYKIIWESPSSIWVRFSGTVTFNETVNATNAVYADFRSDQIKSALWDFSAIDDFSVAEREVEEMAATDHAASLYMKPMRAAFILTDPRLKSLGEQYIAFMLEMGSPWQNRLFENLTDARKWVETLH